jgi:hypothetical protein
MPIHFARINRKQLPILASHHVTLPALLNTLAAANAGA